MKEVFGPPRVFDVVVPLERNGEPFVTVHVGVRTTLLRAFYAPWLAEALTLMGFVLAAALLAGFLLSNLALHPLKQISLQLDAWNGLGNESGSEVGNGAGAAIPRNMAQGEVAQEEARASRGDMAASVSHKIERFGQRMRNVEEVFSALKENLDRILGNLQDGILLFTGDGRVVLVSEAARRFLLIEREGILGRQAREIFDPATLLGRTLIAAFDSRASLIQEEILTEAGRRIQVSLDFIPDAKSSRGLGALLTLHDIESAEAVESELELSRRMAAIGRLTSGVGHEVKNPINAIVVHLELLKTKLGGASAPALRHLEVIDAEIHRLDRVVQTLVDFTRPVELALLHAPREPYPPDTVPAADGQYRRRPAQASGLERYSKRRAIHARRRPVARGARRRAEVRPSAHPRPGPWHSPRDSRKNLRPLFHHQKRRKRHRPGHDLPHSPIALRKRRSTIEFRTWH